jgi:hypothetical protein
MKSDSTQLKLCLAVLAAVFVLTFSARLQAQVMIDIATDLTDPCNFADSEPSIAVNPLNSREIAVLTFSEGWGPSRNSRTELPCKTTQDESPAPVWKSLDGGVTWRKEFIIPQSRDGQGGPVDQRVAFDAAGRLIIVAMDDGFVTRIYSQSDPAAPALIAGSGFGNDQPQLDVDRFGTSPCFNRVYSPWNNTSNKPYPLAMVSNSLDRGMRVTDAIVGDNNFPNRTTRIAISPDGTVYAVYKTEERQVDSHFQRAHFRIVRSEDCGRTWAGAVSGGAAVHGSESIKTWLTKDGDGFGNAAKGGRTNRARSSDAWVAVDRSGGFIYVAYVSVDASGFSQIFVARSSDRGETWTSSRIPDDGHHCAYPEIAVADNGTVGVLYVDFDDSGPTTIFRHRFVKSFDHTVTWPAAAQKILQSMDPGTLDNDDDVDPGYIWGDYEGLTAEADTFYGVFTGESLNRQQRQLDPIFFTEPAAPELVKNHY